MSSTIIEIKDLVCGYDSFSLQEINLNLKRGEFVGIIGPNGSGKTTLLRAISGVLKIKIGEILFAGQDIRSLGIKEIAKKLAFVSQNSEMSFISVEDFVLLGRIPHYKKFQFLETKRDMDIMKKCMTLTGSLKFKDKLMEKISGGERQLALIARALSQEPQLLILDEPTTHLDINLQVRILDLICRLNRETGLTIIMVLHDLNMAAEYCHRLVLMNAGKIHSIGSPKEVLTWQVIEDVYDTVVKVDKNPISYRPHIFLVSGEEQYKKEIKIKRRK
jgi:iron complex transport system ATP-binding protein